MSNKRSLYILLGVIVTLGFVGFFAINTFDLNPAEEVASTANNGNSIITESQENLSEQELVEKFTMALKIIEDQ